MPEVYSPPWQQQQQQHSAQYSAYSGATPDGLQYQPLGQDAITVGAATAKHHKLELAPTTVRKTRLLYSVAIALFVVAVAGLAVGAGIAISKYKNAESKLEEVRLPPASSDWSYMTNNCSKHGESTTGQGYRTRCKYALPRHRGL